jgi:hypothetical protein
MTAADKKFEWEMLTRKIEHEREIHDRETRRLAALEYARMVATQDDRHIQYAKEYGFLAIRSLFLLNGGALVSLVAFAGNSVGKQNMVTGLGISLALFVFGLIFAVVAMALSFWNFTRASETNANFGALANAIIQLNNWPSAVDADVAKDMRNSYNWAVGNCFLSLICFAFGCALVAGQLQ